jgi:hypothetical protein
MEKQKRTLNHDMRALHRDIGFFVVGLIILYSLSGIVLIYRDTDFLKHEAQIEKKLSPNLQVSELGAMLRLKDFKVLKTEGDILYFPNGSYNALTGVAEYTRKELPVWLDKFCNLHKTASQNPAHWFTTVFGALLFFLAISSFWMFKAGTRLFRRGIIIAGTGIVFTVILLLI